VGERQGKAGKKEEEGGRLCKEKRELQENIERSRERRCGYGKSCESLLICIESSRKHRGIRAKAKVF
jgi:hypothetical protein